MSDAVKAAEEFIDEAFKSGIQMPAARLMRALLNRIAADGAMYRVRTATLDEALSRLESIPGQMSWLEADELEQP